MQSLAILGGGESGVGTAILGKKKGFHVFLSDAGCVAEKYRKILLEHAVDFEENTHTASKILAADVVVKSPGIPDSVAIVQQLLSQGTPVISEIEFTAQYTQATIVGITGSNGKTTTTLLVDHVLQSAKRNAGVAGNIGASFAQQVAEENYDTYTLELSSFQLDGTRTFAPHIAIITNITPDHLDRYDYDFEKYIASKFTITKYQTANDFLIYDADDSVICTWLETHTTSAQLVPFSLEKKVPYGAYLENNNIHIILKKEQFTMGINTLTLQGKHNTKNAMAATLASKLLKVRNQTIKESLAVFEGAEHRLEMVQKVHGVQYINDSKATNINATFYALECMTNATVWIVGGVDKGNDYTELMSLVREKVKAIVCLGVDNQKIIETFEGVVDILVETVGAEEAVKVANKLAKKGENVLLSPACASFDLFESYEDRGRQFKQAVRSL